MGKFIKLQHSPRCPSCMSAHTRSNLHLSPHPIFSLPRHPLRPHSFFHLTSQLPLQLPLLCAHLTGPNPAMADASPTYRRNVGRLNPTAVAAALLHRLQAQAPNSPQLMGFLTLVITGSILIFITGLTVTATILGFIFFTPLIIISSPIWVPIGTVLFVVVVGFLFFCGFGVAAVTGLSWMYRYFWSMQPRGSERVDYARSRIYDTASHVKDTAREYGGYLQTKAKDAAPGA